MDKKFIFVCQDDLKQIFISRKNDVEMLIKTSEALNEELDFKVIGRIQEPPQGLSIGFNDRLIEWYDKETMPEKRLIDEAVLKIIEYIMNNNG